MMDSEDDMHNVNDIDSYEQDYYSGHARYSDAEDAAEYEFLHKDSDDDVLLSRQQKSYTILKEDDIHQRQENDITTICSVLSISRDSACTLLLHYNWNVSNVHEAWFANEDKVRKTVGLLEKMDLKQPKAGELPCGICFESYSLDKISSVACAHPFCNTCWAAYISSSISDGPGCLTMKCPIPSCGVALGMDLVNMLTSDENKKKYRRYLVRSYIESNIKTKWCPAPGCDCAIEFELGSGSYDVTCHCSYSFCWNCTEEAHRPVNCETVCKWIRKNNAQSESYQSQKQTRAYDESERRRAEMAKNSLERYTHYYEHWATNHLLRQKALMDLHQMQTIHLANLSDKQRQPETQLNFITEAWLQIVECRRVLKWTHVYGYYLPEHEYAKRQFFEYLQGEAEAGLERLEQCAEKELYTYLNDNGSQDEFNNFKTKLATLTSDTHDYFEKFVGALENGLSDVDAHGASSSKNAAGTSKIKGTKAKWSNKVGATSRTHDSTWWSCDHCTFMNPKTATSCQMCDSNR